jgi:hypothetical protein
MNIRRTAATTLVVSITCGIYLSAQSANATAPSSVTNADVLSLHIAGFSDDFIIAKIHASSHIFTVQISDLLELKKAGISERVIQIMLAEPTPPSPVVTVPAPVLSPERRAIEPPASDRCPTIAATLAAAPGVTLAEKIRAYKQGSYLDYSDERLERLFRDEFPCVSTINAAGKPQTSPSQMPLVTQAASASTKGCLVVKDAGSHAFRNIVLGGIAGALISKKQYQVVDAVDYPAKMGQKFHGNDLQTLQAGGTRIVILNKQYTPEDLHKACR